MPWTKLLADSYSKETSYRRRMPKRRSCTYGAALREGLSQALSIDERVFVLGEGVDDPGGVFGSTRGLDKQYGKMRVFDVPLAENGFTGFAVGAAIAGMRPVVVHMRVDFMLLSLDQLINHAAKWRYMFGGAQHVPITIRCIIGRGWGSAAQHSQALEGLFMYIPGLKLVCPATPYDAKGLLLASIADNDPVIFVEHRWLYTTREYVPQKPYIETLGKAQIKRPGKDVTIIAYSLMLHESLAAAELLAQQGVDAEVIDVRTLKPLDINTLVDSARRTKRVVIASLDWNMGGVASTIATLITEKVFDVLAAPVQRIALPDVPTPASHILENEFYRGKDDIVKSVCALMKKKMPKR